MWFSVDDMTDYVKNNVNINSVTDKNKTTKLQNLKKELLIPLTREDRLDAVTNQRYTIIYDPPGNGHCVKSVQIRSFFWSVFFRTQTEYGEIRSISPYSV